MRIAVLLTGFISIATLAVAQKDSIAADSLMKKGTTYYSKNGKKYTGIAFTKGPRNSYSQKFILDGVLAREDMREKGVVWSSHGVEDSVEKESITQYDKNYMYVEEHWNGALGRKMFIERSEPSPQKMMHDILGTSKSMTIMDFYPAGGIKEIAVLNYGAKVEDIMYDIHGAITSNTRMSIAGNDSLHAMNNIDFGVIDPKLIIHKNKVKNTGTVLDSVKIKEMLQGVWAHDMSTGLGTGCKMKVAKDSIISPVCDGLTKTSRHSFRVTSIPTDNASFSPGATGYYLVMYSGDKAVSCEAIRSITKDKVTFVFQGDASRTLVRVNEK